MKIAMIGLGKMGANMATRLLRSGHQVVAYDLNKQNIRDLEAEGAAGARTLAEVAAKLAAPRVVWCQHHNGIFRSDDGGENFVAIEAARPSGFGFATVVDPEDPDRAWFVPAVKDECRIPVDQQLLVTRTRDGGASFEALSAGLPPPPAFDLIYRHGLDLDPASGRLAMGSTTGNLWVGEEGGNHWHGISRHLPPINQVLWSAPT